MPSQASLTRRATGAPNRAYLVLGSNVDAERNLPAAAERLRKRCRVLASSRVYQSPAFGSLVQPDFLNGAMVVETELSAEEFRQHVIRPIEAELGRQRAPDQPDGPRTIDIDLALFNRQVLRIGARQVPDPDILEQACLAVPLSEVDPDYVHPVDGRTLGEIAGRFDRTSAGLVQRNDVSLQR